MTLNDVEIRNEGKKRKRNTAMFSLYIGQIIWFPPSRLWPSIFIQDNTCQWIQFRSLLRSIVHVNRTWFLIFCFGTTTRQASNLYRPCAPLLAVRHNWWGQHRVDYSVHCPDGLQAIMARARARIFHASYWESSDVAAFVLRQVGRRVCATTFCLLHSRTIFKLCCCPIHLVTY